MIKPTKTIKLSNNATSKCITYLHHIILYNNFTFIFKYEKAKKENV